MGVSFKQLRETCQIPVRHGNDVAGLIFGDWASLPITKLFVDLHLTPNIATLGMLVCGVLGAALQVPAAGALWAVSGALLLLLYYVLDCVDGEVARFHGIEDMRWGYYDYLFHLIVKPVCFLGVGIGCWRQLGSPWFLVAGAAAAIAVLWLKVFLEIPGILFMHGVLAGAPGGSPAFRRFLRSITPAAAPTPAAAKAAPASASAAPTPSAPPAPPRRGFHLGFDTVTLRAVLTNFDLGLLYLVIATVLDLRFGPWSVGGVVLTARAAWLTFYALMLPLDFIDHVRTYLRRGHFASETQRLLALAHHYRFDPAAAGATGAADADDATDSGDAARRRTGAA